MVVAILDDGPLKGKTFRMDEITLGLRYIESSIEKGFARLREFKYEAWRESMSVVAGEDSLRSHCVHYRFDGVKEYE